MQGHPSSDSSSCSLLGKDVHYVHIHGFMKRGKKGRGLTTQFLALMNVSLCGLDKESILTPFGSECLT